jgi:hypothetical protein
LSDHRVPNLTNSKNEKRGVVCHTIKPAYNGKIEHHGGRHRAQAIALLAAKKDKIGTIHTKDAYKLTIFSIVGFKHGLVESSVSFTISSFLYP